MVIKIVFAPDSLMSQDFGSGHIVACSASAFGGLVWESKDCEKESLVYCLSTTRHAMSIDKLSYTTYGVHFEIIWLTKIGSTGDMLSRLPSEFVITVVFVFTCIGSILLQPETEIAWTSLGPKTIGSMGQAFVSHMA